MIDWDTIKPKKKNNLKKRIAKLQAIKVMVVELVGR